MRGDKTGQEGITGASGIESGYRVGGLSITPASIAYQAAATSKLDAHDARLCGGRQVGKSRLWGTQSGEATRLLPTRQEDVDIG